MLHTPKGGVGKNWKGRPINRIIHQRVVSGQFELFVHVLFQHLYVFIVWYPVIIANYF